LKTCVKQVPKFGKGCGGVLATGSLTTVSSSTATCKYKMVMKQSPSGALRLGIERKSQACGPKLDVVTVKPTRPGAESIRSTS
jgi:hypothetical protein